MLFELVQEQIRDAMRAKDQGRLLTLRSILSAYKNALVAGEKKDSLSDEECLVIIKKLVKQRKEAITQFETAGRADLVEKEQAELSILESYLPAEMSDADVHALVTGCISELGATSSADRGKVIGIAIKKANGQADGAPIKTLVEQLLA